MTPIRLFVNIDHVATIRQARRTDEPDPVAAARLCEAAGADGITAHLREDRRHIVDDDLVRLTEAVQTVLNIELATDPGIVDLVCRLKPHQATLVPERREEVTTEGGLDLRLSNPRFIGTIDQLMTAGCRVSLFIDPTPEAVAAAAALGVPAVEFHTGGWAHSWPDGATALAQLVAATDQARAAGLAVHAGHGLTYRNVQSVASIPGIEELNIGHSIVSRAVMTGMEEAVTEMGRLIRSARERR